MCLANAATQRESKSMELGPDNFKKHYWLHIPHPKVNWEDAAHSSFLWERECH